MENKFNIDKNFEQYSKLFLQENLKLNLISHNDAKFLFEKHIYDSLAIKLFFLKYHQKFNNILDIGCGGGFPCVPIAIEYPGLEITGLDSIRKKIDAISRLKTELKLDNLNLVCDRAENIKDRKFDLILSRAVGNLGKICEYALPLLDKGGFFVAYKSKKMYEEIDAAQSILKKYNAKIIDIIEYTLPLDVLFERNLVIIRYV